MSFGLGPGFENFRIAHQQAKVIRLRAGSIDQAGPMPLRQLGFRQRIKPGQPAQFVLSKGDRFVVAGMNDD
jgi:hypothetical protein